jgi:hypothetical protein
VRRRLRIAGAFAASLVLLAACVDFAPGVDLLPSASGWQSLPIRGWLMNEGFGPVTIVYCGPSRCAEPSVVATFVAEGETALRLEHALETPKTLLMAKRYEVEKARDPRFKRKPASERRKSSEHVERLAADGLDGYKVTLASEIAGGHPAYAVVLARRADGIVKVAFAVSTDPDTALQEARAAAKKL